jgi:predicted DNA-binding protein
MLLTQEEADFLKEQARREGRTASDLVRSAIERLYRPRERIEALLTLEELKGDYLDRMKCLERLQDLYS